MTARHYYSGGSQNKNSLPGPGNYNSDKVNYTTNKAPTWRIGTATREDNMKNIMRQNFPGPGNYHTLNSEKGPKYSFGHDQRVKSASSTVTPGPGQYKLPTTIFNVPNFVTGGWDPNFKFV